MNKAYETSPGIYGGGQMDSSVPDALLSIDLAGIARNYETLKRKAGAAEVAGVVKADCYGLGIKKIAPVLKDLGCKTWFVASLKEGMALREMLGREGLIAVLGGAPKGSEITFTENDLIPVLNCLEDIENWCVNGSGPAIIHFDTGMNRLGLGRGETEFLLSFPKTLKSLDVFMIMSHFACADEPGHHLTERQYRRFMEIAGHFPDAKKSLANSAGFFSSPDYTFDLVRPGYALYGGNPVPGKENPMNSIASLEARIIQIRPGHKGDSTGYGATHVFTEDRMLATVAFGYADGFSRASGKASLFWQGYPCPVVGRISMDLTVVDITDLPCPAPDAGDYLEVLGSSQSIDDLAKMAGTIGYEVLTSLGKRYERRYIT
jgi:alanine racemase